MPKPSPGTGSSPGGYLFAGGGTGGHLFPAIAIVDALRARDPSAPVLFLGSERPLERRIVSSAGYDHASLPTPSSSLARRRPVKYAVQFWRALQQAHSVVARFRPAVVIGCGGFSSVPAVRAAFRTRTPVALLEQNLHPGRATRWLSRQASAVCLAFEESRQFLSHSVHRVVTGNPVRADLTRASDRNDTSANARPTLLVLGGSLGAEEINFALLAGVANDADRWRDWTIVHQTGDRMREEVRAFYKERSLDARVEAFLDDVPARLMTAAIVVTRAGATSLAEAACAGAACVVVPWKRAAADHQTFNARWYADRGAVLLGAANRELAEMWAGVIRLADDPALRRSLSERMRQVARPDATQQVLRVLDQMHPL